MTIKKLKYLALFLVGASAFAATGKLQNSDFATPAQLVSAGGTVSQLLNTSKVYDSTNNQLLDTTIASKLTGPLTGDVTTIGSAATVKFVSGSTSASVHTGELLANAATANNVASAIVRRNASGGFDTTTASILTGYFGGGLGNGATIGAVNLKGTDSLGSQLILEGPNGVASTRFLYLTQRENGDMYFFNPAGLVTLAYDWANRSLFTGNQGGIYHLEANYPDSSTSPGTPSKYSGIASVNPDATDGNYNMLAFQGQGPNAIPDSAIFGIHDLHSGSGATASGSLEFWTRDVGTFARRLRITPSGGYTFDSLSTGLMHFNSSGVASSSPVSLTVDVTGLLPNANLANPSTTVNGVTCTLGSTCSVGSSTPLSIGAIDGQTKSANGLVTASNVLYAQTADASFPGLVSTGAQTLAGAKTLNGTLNLNTVTASRFLRADASKNVTSSLVNLANSTTDITGTLAVGNGGTGSASTPTNGQIPIGNGTSYVPATITAGTNVTIVNSAGGITVSASSSGGSGYGTTSQAYVAGYSSAGSTNTKIIAFSSAVANVGTDVTYASSATLGDSFTINTTGLYEVAFNTYSTGAQYIGFTVNATQLSTAISSLLYSDGNRGMTYINGAGIVGAITRTLNLTAGDVVRAQYDGAANLSGGTTYVQFSVTRVK